MRHHKDWGDGLLGDKSHSVLFDNTQDQARSSPTSPAPSPSPVASEEVMAWFDADHARQVIDPGFDRAMDEVVEAMASDRRGG